MFWLHKATSFCYPNNKFLFTDIRQIEERSAEIPPQDKRHCRRLFTSGLGNFNGGPGVNSARGIYHLQRRGYREIRRENQAGRRNQRLRYQGSVGSLQELN